MALSEFDIIQQVFSQQTISRNDVVLGIGDDAALLSLPTDHELAISVDTLVEGVHFPVSMSPRDVGYRSLAVNLSDMAAMGAEPAWMTLAISLPESNSRWLTAFASGLFALASEHNVQLVGGDTTRGAMTISIQIMGHVPTGQALRRQGAKPGDLICVTGMLGEAAAGLATWTSRDASSKRFRDALARPTPRVAEGRILRDVASSCLDISDGLLADLGHIVSQSNVGAMLNLAHLPISLALCDAVGMEQAREYALSGGDDYELCFTIAPAHLAKLNDRLQAYVIGEIESEPGIRCWLPGGEAYEPGSTGFRHF